VERRQLEYFLAVVEHGGFTAAAQAIFVAQPSLSQSIRSLENELGVQLFDRVREGTRLTTAGEALLAPARRALREFDAARVAVSAVRGLVAGRLDIATMPALSVDPLPALLARFHGAHPGVSYRVLDASQSDFDRLLETSEVEIAFSVTEPRGTNLRTHAFPDVEMFLAYPPNFPEAATNAEHGVEELGLVVWTPSRALVLEALASRGIVASVAVETDHQAAIVPFVLSGLGVGLLGGVRAREVKAGGGSLRSLEPPLVRRALMVAAGGPLSPAAAAFWQISTEATGPG
jgi:DNA-binding transcriptional LysR family regulator